MANRSNYWASGEKTRQAPNDLSVFHAHVSEVRSARTFRFPMETLEKIMKSTGSVEYERGDVGVIAQMLWWVFSS